jgi:cell division transport system permease protein
MHVLAVALVFSLLGLALLAFIHSVRLEDRISTETPYIIELRKSYAKDSLEVLKDWLNSQSGIVPGSLQLITKEEALKEMTSDPRMDIALTPGENPFFDIIWIGLDPKQDQEATIQKIQAHLRTQSIVNLSGDHVALKPELAKSLGKIKTVFIFVTLLTAILAFLVTGYLVRVYIRTKFEIIQLWRLLGSTEEKITKPYIRIAITHGVASALMAIGLMGLALLALFYLSPWIYNLIDLKNFVLVMLVLLVIGPTLHILGIRRALNSYLNK